MRRLFLILPALFLLAFPAHADLIKQSGTYTRTVLMTSSSDHINGVTGLTLTIQISKAGGAPATITPTVTPIGSGRYAIALTTGNTDTLGALDMIITAAGADPTDTHDQVYSALDTNLITIAGAGNAVAATGGVTFSPGTVSTYAGGDTAGTTILKAALVTAIGTTAPNSLGTAINTTLTASVANCYKGQIIVFSSGPNIGQTYLIASNTAGANSTLTIFTSLGASLSTGNTFSLVTGEGQKMVDMLSALGTDNRPLVSANAHTSGETTAGLTGYVAPTTPPTVTQIRQEMDANSTKLAWLTGDAFVRLGAPTGASIAADIQTRLAASGYTAPPAFPTNFANLLITGGAVTVGAFGAGVTVPLPTTAPTGYGGTSSVTDTTIQADVTAALNAALPGTPTAGSLFDLLKKVNAAIALSVRNLPAVQVTTGTGASKVSVTKYYPSGTVITGAGTAAVVSGGVASVYTGTTTYDASGNPTTVYTSP